MKQAEVNVGTAGHIDHGKTTLVKSLTGVWTDKHSEEIKRGITIKLGYADMEVKKCPKHEPPEAYSTEKNCPICRSKTESIRTISFVDAPGHEMLMATMLSGAAIMDGAILVIATNEECPQPQTKEHLMALEIIGIKKVIIAQTKIDLVSGENLSRNYEQIKKFIKGTCAENAPIIPVCAHTKANIDVLINAIQDFIPTPKRDLEKPPKMYIARSFDVNLPGAHPEKLCGGVVGGSLIQGKFKVGEEIEIRPGQKIEHGGKTFWQPITTTIVSLHAGGKQVEEVGPGGLIGIGTKLDPSMTKADALVGGVVGKPGQLPPTRESLTLETHLLERVVGLLEETMVEPIKAGEQLMLNVGTATTVGDVTNAKKDEIIIKLKIPVCAESKDRVAISRRIKARWRLIGYGIIK
ncbi:MAG: translation initiation factor IF-2 subunit gamma [Euryarchaeota archaeon]|nr:translation initiation factor IF-2 subunit gamma [Euryarchaeota archaeon]